MKDFGGWIKLKEQINEGGNRPPSYKERQIWWMSVGVNIGFEEDGKGTQYSRPVLIVKGFNKELFWGIPLSTTKNRGKYYHEFFVEGTLSVALLSQLRAYDTLRLKRKIGMIDQKDFADVIKRMKQLFPL